ncbi:hypothetical protein LCGC14_1108830 [marine sediment metagenome]|uniref:HotDog ACOT-type domain-containing protein n=1 Tax=marine sediment metagenome TaxID=412755 RepID=A0A0F9QDM3_9ZZZZ
MELITSKICMTKDVGLHGNLFGGNMMAWADEAAAIYAKDKVDHDLVVTRHIGEINFTKPVKVGTTIKFYGNNCSFGNSNITFDLTVIDTDGAVYFTTSFTFVTVDQDGNKIKLFKHNQV